MVGQKKELLELALQLISVSASATQFTHMIVIAASRDHEAAVKKAPKDTQA